MGMQGKACRGVAGQTTRETSRSMMHVIVLQGFCLQCIGARLFVRVRADNAEHPGAVHEDPQSFSLCKALVAFPTGLLAASQVTSCRPAGEAESTCQSKLCKSLALIMRAASAASWADHGLLETTVSPTETTKKKQQA